MVIAQIVALCAIVYQCHQCILPQKLCVRFLFLVRCTRLKFVISNLIKITYLTCSPLMIYRGTKDL